MMKSKSRNFFLSGILAFIMVLGFSLGIGISGFGKTDSVYAYSDNVLNYTSQDMPKIEVSNFEEFRNALTSNGNKFIVVTQDFEYESERETTGSYRAINKISVKDNKILYLNGHSIYVSDKSAIRWNSAKNEHEYVGYKENSVLESAYWSFYIRCLIEVKNAELTIVDAPDNKGEIHYDCMFSDMTKSPSNVHRDVVWVGENGVLNVHGGTLIAGRSKQVYSSDVHDSGERDQIDQLLQEYSYHPDHTSRRTVTVYNSGCAVLVDGGTANITGGKLIGHGISNLGYTGNFATKGQTGGIAYNNGYLNIEGGEFYGYGFAPALGIMQLNPMLVEMEEAREYNLNILPARVRIHGGYFYSKIEKNASFLDENGTIHILKPENMTLQAVLTSKDYQYYNNTNIGNFLNLSSFGVATESETEDADKITATLTKVENFGGSDYGDTFEGYYNYTPKQTRTLSEGISHFMSSNANKSIYQYENLIVKLDNMNELCMSEQIKFYSSDFGKAYVGEGFNQDDYSVTATFTISKVVGNNLTPYKYKTFAYDPNAEKPINYLVKNPQEKWDVGNYKVDLTIVEKCGDKFISTKSNQLSLEVKAASEMIYFQDVTPEEYPVNGNLGNVNVGSTQTFKFNTKFRGLIADNDQHVQPGQQLFVKKPGSNKYEEVLKDENGIYSILVDTQGYYSVRECAQIILDGEIVSQISREIHFTGVDTTKAAERISYNLSDYYSNSQIIGKTILTDIYGTTKTSFNYGEVVCIQATPGIYGRLLRVDLETASGGHIEDIHDMFMMPNENVTVKFYFAEKLRTVNYRETAQSAIDDTVYYDYTEGLVLKGKTYSKPGYVQTGWKIGNNTYALGDTFRERAIVTAIPVFSPIQYTQVNYVINDNTYEHEINYDYDTNPYYSILGDVNIPSALLEGLHIDYYTIHQDYTSEIEDVTYPANTRFYPGQKIIPMQNGITLYAHTQASIVLNPLEIAVQGNNLLNIGTNNFGLEADNVKFLTNPDPSLDQRLTEIVLVAKTPKTIRVYVYPEDGYRFADDLTFSFPNFFEQAVTNAFSKEPLVEKFLVGLNGTSIGLDITFYPSCGTTYADHNWGAEPTDTAHWCIGYNYEEYVCEDCGAKKYVEVVNPGNLTIEQTHRLRLVEEVEGDCSHGEYSIDRHYECDDCGKWFTRHGIGVDSYYEEITIDDVRYLHSWSDYVPRTIDGKHVHCYVCAVCGAIDENSIGFHHNDEYGYGECDDCIYEIPCEHQWNYVEDLSTCNHQGRMTRTCTICGTVEETLYNYADHELVYVGATESTCSTHGHLAHYMCSHCGKLFDVDIYAYIKTLDTIGLRFIHDIEEEGCEYALTDDLLAILEAEYDLDNNYKYEDQLNPGLYLWDWAYIQEHSTAYGTNATLKKVVDAHYILKTVNEYTLAHGKTANQLRLALDPNNHAHTELRDAVAVTVDADGYSGDLYCTECDTKIEDGHVIEKHEHAYVGTAWESNDTHHWHICNAFDGCTEELDKAEHTYGDWHYVTYADQVGKKWKECSVCGHVHIENYTPEPSINGDDKDYKITEGLEDLTDDEGKDVRYIFDLASENDGSVTFETDVATITFDKDAVKDIAGHNVKFKVTTSKENLNIYNIPNAQMVLVLSLNGVTFTNGKAKVVVPIDIQIPEGNEVKVYYVNGDNKEDMHATYTDGKISFETTHFSTYVLAYEAPEQPPVVNPENPTNNGLGIGAIIGIIVGVLALAGGAFCVYWFVFRKKKVIAFANTETEKEAVVFSEKKTLNEQYALLSKEDRKLYDKIKAHAMTLENVKTSEAQDYYTVSYKKEKIVRFKLKKGEIIAEFFANDKDFKEVTGTGAKETASSVIKVKTEEDANKVIEAIDYKYKSLTDKKD